MLRISNLSFSYQSRVLFEGVSLNLTRPEVAVVIGDNGVGKTTLLRLIAGELRPDEGSVKAAGEIGFLRQTLDELDGTSGELGFLPKMLDGTEGKSGGEKTQMRLVELFRERPEILLLDEPTNNLDAESKAWLVRNLRDYRGLALVVSHDREFLRMVAERIIWLNDGKIENFSGGYASFCEQKARLEQERWQNYEQLQKKRKKLERRMKDAHDRAHKSNRRNYNKISDESRLRFNGQRMAAQNSAGKVLRVTQGQIERLAAVERPRERKIYKAEVVANFLHDKKLLEVRNLTKSFLRKELFRGLNFEVRTGERVRVLGRNGSGKSTLFRIIMGEKADAGEVFLADGVKVGYIAQDEMGFDLAQSFLAQNGGIKEAEILRAAVTMDFTSQDMNRPIRELSRGQLTKMAILRLILQPLDLVIIDEITNHIDIRARENIEMALKNYRGAILMATHDEDFAQEIGFTKEIELG